MSTDDPRPASAALTDENYNSEEDSDFDPTSAAAVDDAELSSSSDDDSDEASKPSQKPKKRKRTMSLDDTNGEGGLVKTRSQRAAETREKLGGVKQGKVTTDVDALWAQLSSAPVKKPQSPKPEKKEVNQEIPSNAELAKEQAVKEVTSETGEKMVVIKRTYEFAGQTITEEKLVPASSSTARAHLSSTTNTSESLPANIDSNAPKKRAPPKKRASAFDFAAAARAKPAAPTKINTLEKSRLDWAGFVDKEGIADDLQKFNKGDKGYLDRQAFLGRVDQNRDQQWKEANKKK